MAKRYRESGKERLILLVLSDFDPEGEEIAHSFARDLRDEHGVKYIEPVKVALTHAQVQQLALVPDMEAKVKSTNYKKFVDKYGTNVFELEAVPPATLQQMLRDAVDSVLDTETFNAEIQAEQTDWAYLDPIRRRVLGMLQQELTAE